MNIWIMGLTSKVDLVFSNAEFQQSKYDGRGQLMLRHLADGRSKTAVVERSVDGTKLIVTKVPAQVGDDLFGWREREGEGERERGREREREGRERRGEEGEGRRERRGRRMERKKNEVER